MHQSQPKTTPAVPDWAPFGNKQEHSFMWRVSDDHLEATDDRVRDVMGCKADNFSWETWMDLLHPSDAAAMPMMKAALLRFFNEEPIARNPGHYHAAFLFRVRAAYGAWKHVLHRSYPAEFLEDGSVNRLGVTHTTVGFLGVIPLNRISFIGNHKHPSYFALVPEVDRLLPASSALDLTKREMAVFAATMDGLTSRQIADKLFITKNTVDTHRRKLLRKTGAKNMTELAMRLARDGTL